jgi:hypothetical protein
VVVAVKLPDVPVTVTVNVPVVAVVLAVKDNMLVDVAGFGLKADVTPAGTPEAASVTFPVNPFTGVIVIVLVPLVPPLAIVTALGAAESVKLFTRAFTVKLMVVVAVSDPEVPVIVTVTVPVVAVELAVRVNVVLPAAGLGLNAAVTPEGRPEAENVTLSSNPPDPSIVIVVVPFPPCSRLRLLGFACRVKFGGIPGQLFTRLLAFTVPIPVGKSHPVVVVYAG